MNNQLKGTVAILVFAIIQSVIVGLAMLATPAAAIFLLDVALMWATYIGFKKGVRGWAIFAIVYGAVSYAIAISQGNLLNMALGVLIVGIVALQE